MELLIEMSQTDDQESNQPRLKVIEQSSYSQVMEQEFPEIPSPSRASLITTVAKSPVKKLQPEQANGLKSSSLSKIGSKMSVCDEDKEWLEWIENIHENSDRLMIIMRGLPGR